LTQTEFILTDLLYQIGVYILIFVTMKKQLEQISQYRFVYFLQEWPS